MPDRIESMSGDSREEFKNLNIAFGIGAEQLPAVDPGYRPGFC